MARDQSQYVAELADLVIKLEVQYTDSAKHDDAKTTIEKLVNSGELASIRQCLQNIEQKEEWQAAPTALRDMHRLLKEIRQNLIVSQNQSQEQEGPQDAQNKATQTDETEPQPDQQAVVEQKNEINSGVDCDVCPQQHPATQMCLDCNKHLCQQASEWHSRFQPHLQHRVCSIEEFKANPYLAQNVRMCEHGEPYRFYDERCGIPVCRDCLVLDHMSHECSTLANAASKYCQTITTDLTNVQNKLEHCQTSQLTVENVCVSLNINHRAATLALASTFQQVSLFVCVCFF